MLRSKYKLQLFLKLFLLIFYRGLLFCTFVIMKLVYTLRLALQNVQKWTRTRKTFSAILLCIFLLLILWNSKILYASSDAWFSTSRTSEQTKKFSPCMNFGLLPFKKLTESFGAFISYVPAQPFDNPFLPYIGNGYISIETELDSRVHIKHGRTLNTPIPYMPTVGISRRGFSDSRSVVLNIEQGIVHQIQCYDMDGLCVNVKSLFYAHRRRPSILVQEINLSNPTSSPVEFELDLKGFQACPSTNVSKFKLLDLNVFHGFKVVESDNARSYAVVVMGIDLPQEVKVDASSTTTLSSMTCVRYVELPRNAKEDEVFEDLKNKAIEDLKQANSRSIKKLREEHTSAWQSLWSSGFYISDSLAQGVVNGHQINRTMYYVLSNSRSPLQEVETRKTERKALQTSLYTTDRCYGGHHTLQNMKMWTEVSSIQDVINVAMVWSITLEKHGCGRMMEAGAEGMIQSMILSYGALRFNDNHLEFCTHPSDLHRDIYFRRVNYGRDTHVNISVRVGADNKASLYVSLDRNNLTYHACDAGCLDPPVRLSKEEVTLPVKLTNPVTPILYITSDLQHMEELRHAIHVHSVDEAPAHEHHVIIMHKHGHKWGGLPIIFWATISILIIIFHLFLFKLVYSEYCSPQEAKTTRHYSIPSSRRHI